MEKDKSPTAAPKAKWLAFPFVHVSTYRANSFYPWHAHDYDQICVPISGRLQASYENERSICGPGSIMVFPSGRPHSILHLELDCTVISIIRNPEHAVENTIHRSFTFIPKGRNQFLNRMIKYQRTDIAGVSDYVESIIRGTPPAAQCPPVPSWSSVESDALAQLQKDVSLSLSKLAVRLNISRTTLAQKFKQRFGCSIGNYSQGLRLSRALRLLRASNRPLVDIANELGFSDQAHMTRQFDKLLGVSPGSVRKEALRQP